ncbi:hypothetical protein SAMN05444166_5518 [Singulisphaera sp. GP187]|nr:hypothetical protein SAMN05444166_5518 [Singulisphaera sp. GP187]
MRPTARGFHRIGMSHYFGYRGFVTGEIGIIFLKGAISATGTACEAGQFGRRGGNLARVPPVLPLRGRLASASNRLCRNSLGVTGYADRARPT